MIRYLPLLLVFFSACKKSEPLVEKKINGVVINTITKTPVAGQKVELKITTQKIIKTNEPEWPNGKPVFEDRLFYTTSDAAGHYQFNVKIPDLPWTYFAGVPTGAFIMTSRIYHMFPINESVGLRPDSIFVERPGYVRYIVKTPGAAFENESLYVNTPYHNQFIRPDNTKNGYTNYNWLFFGKTDRTIMDTIPAESNTNPDVEWLRMLSDTIQHKKEKIQVRAGSTTEYLIQY